MTSDSIKLAREAYKESTLQVCWHIRSLVHCQSFQYASCTCAFLARRSVSANLSVMERRALTYDLDSPYREGGGEGNHRVLNNHVRCICLRDVSDVPQSRNVLDLRRRFHTITWSRTCSCARVCEKRPAHFHRRCTALNTITHCAQPASAFEEEIAGWRDVRHWKHVRLHHLE